MSAVRQYVWMGTAALGLVLLALGVFFVVKGPDAKAQVQAALEREQIVTRQDAAIPGVPVADASTAKAQADIIEKHSVDRWGRYSQMERDDPNRDLYLKGLTLRTSLNLAVLSMGVADLAIGTGAVVMLLGLGALGVGGAALYALRQPQKEGAWRHGGQAVRAAGQP